MKEEIEKASRDHIEVDRSDRYQSNYWDGYEEGFEKGAEFVLSKFNNLSPATVAEMVEALRKANEYFNSQLIEHSETSLKAVKTINEVLSKADKELKV